MTGSGRSVEVFAHSTTSIERAIVKMTNDNATRPTALATAGNATKHDDVRLAASAFEA